MPESPVPANQASARFLTAGAPPELANVQISLSLGETSEMPRVQHAWAATVAAHGMLRSRFANRPSGEWIRCESDAQALPWRDIDWSTNAPSEVPGLWARLLAEDAAEPLAGDAILRITGIALPGGHCHQLVTVPAWLLDEDALFHILCFWIETFEGASPSSATEAPPPPQASPATADWWTHYLQGLNGVAELRASPPEPTDRNSRRSETTTLLDREFSKTIRAAAGRLNISPADFFQSVWNLLLSRLLARRDILVLEQRHLSDAPPDTAFSDTILPVRTAINGGQSVESFLRAAGQDAAERRRNASIPLDRIAVLSALPSSSLLTATGFQWSPPPLSDRIHDAFPRWINLDAKLHRRPTLPVLFEVRDGQRFLLALTSDPARIPQTLATRLLQRLVHVARQFATHPTRRLSEVSILDDDERTAFRPVSLPAPAPGRPLDDMLAETAADHATLAAAEGPDGAALTYEETHSHARSLAAWLRAENLADGWNVAVCLTPTPWLPVATLGVLRAGSTCVPLDPEATPEWLAQKLEACDVELVICDSQTSALFRTGTRRVLVLDTEWESVAAVPFTAATPTPAKAAFVFVGTEEIPPPPWQAPDAAFLAASCEATRKHLAVAPGDRIPLLALPGTPAFAETLLVALTTGATLVLGAKEIPPDAAHLRLTSWQWRAFALAAEDFPNLHSICVDELDAPPAVLSRWLSTMTPGVRFVSSSGPCGCAGRSACFATVTGVSVTLPGVPVGTPAPGLRMALADLEGQPLPPGFAGRLVLALESQPDRPTEFPAWRDEDGAIFRSPNAEKLIEWQLATLPGVRDAIVRPMDGEPCAWIVPEDSGAEAMEISLSELPHELRPKSIKAIASIPLNRHGTLDPEKLPKILPASEGIRRPPAPAREWKPVTVLKENHSAPSLYLVHGLNGDPDTYHPLATRLAADWSVHATSARGLHLPDACHLTLADEAAALVEAICASDPEGPYHLAGHGFGAILAFEMARQLRLAGRPVPYLALLGASPPAPARRTGWRAALERVFGNKPPPPAASPVAAAHAKALADYKAAPLEGPVGIVLAAEHGPKVEDAWLECAPDAFFESMSCAADQMLADPGVKRLAVILREWAQSAGTAGE